MSMLFISGEAFGFMIIAFIVGYGLSHYYYQTDQNNRLKNIEDDKKRAIHNMSIVLNNVYDDYERKMLNEVFTVDLIRIILSELNIDDKSYVNCVNIYDELEKDLIADNFPHFFFGYDELSDIIIHHLEKSSRVKK